MFQFCPECKSVLRPKKEGDKVIMFCSCGYTKSDGSMALLKEKKIKDDVAEIDVVDGDKEILPITKAECSECGHGKAYFWTQQTRSADEAETRFLKCEKCKHIWREYD
ncbi:transcription factor S [Candidatus Woesearchaeota archaeon]|nr:transcription factor S [Candidatus Woesearchaeota archaeon]